MSTNQNDGQMRINPVFTDGNTGRGVEGLMQTPQITDRSNFYHVYDGYDQKVSYRGHGSSRSYEFIEIKTGEIVKIPFESNVHECIIRMAVSNEIVTKPFNVYVGSYNRDGFDVHKLTQIQGSNVDYRCKVTVQRGSTPVLLTDSETNNVIVGVEYLRYRVPFANMSRDDYVLFLQKHFSK